MPEDPRTLSTLRATQVDPGPPWRPVVVRAEVDSTNAELVRDPEPWAVLVAERQRAGRGRMGRSWVTTPGASLAVSVVVPAVGMPLGWVPLVAGLALADAITATAGVATGLKWPNDVLAPDDGERKLAGILCEWTPRGIVVGTGVNVGHARAELPLATATSVRAAGGEVTREALLTAYLAHLAALVGDLAEDPPAVRERYAARCLTLGATVVVHAPNEDRHGVAIGVDEEGRLGLDTATGRLWVSAGDVVHVRPANAPVPAPDC